MFNVERKNTIATWLLERGRVNVAALAEALEVSKETIRRDLNELEKEGVAQRTHGGAVLAKGHEDSFGDLRYGLRQRFNVPGKKAIGRAAAELVHPGDTIFLDASSTCMYMGEALCGKTGVTIITNSAYLVSQLGRGGRPNGDLHRRAGAKGKPDAGREPGAAKLPGVPGEQSVYFAQGISAGGGGCKRQRAGNGDAAMHDRAGGADDFALRPYQVYAAGAPYAGGAAGDQNHDYRYAAAKGVGRGNGRGSFDYGQAMSNAEAMGNARGTWPFRWTRRRPEGVPCAGALCSASC